MILGLGLLVVGMVACDTASQETEPVISPNGKPLPVITITPTGTTLAEGEDMTFTITTDKAIDRSITFTPVILGGTTDASQYTIAPVILPPYHTTVDMVLSHPSDYLVEENTTLQFEIGVYSIADRYLTHPNFVKPVYNLTMANVNDPGKLTINFAWDTEDDIDMVTWEDLNDDGVLSGWGDGGATGANPEIDHSIWVSDPDGIYYVNVIDWGVDAFNYTFTIGKPDGTKQVIDGAWDRTAFTMDHWTYWGPADTYRVLKVVHTGSTFVVTAL